MASATRVNTLVLDAGPLITNGHSTLAGLAEEFFTTPSVQSEIRDERARQNLLLWGEKLKVRQPLPKYFQIVSEFAKKTGDYGVLSVTDLQILALTYELECEKNGGDWRLRKAPGQAKINGPSPSASKKSEPKPEGKNSETAIEQEKTTTSITQDVEKLSLVSYEPDEPDIANDSIMGEDESAMPVATPDEPTEVEDDGWSTVAQKQKPRSQKRQFKNRTKKPIDNKKEVQSAVRPITAAPEPAAQTFTADPERIKELPADERPVTPDDPVPVAYDNADEFDEEEDDGEGWITPDNLENQQILDGTLETVKKNGTEEQAKVLKVGMASGDFAMQNVAMQIGLNVINPQSGSQIRKIRSWMLRCHACFLLTAPPTGNVPRQFCPRCGGATLLRCTVTTSASTGQLQVHLKKNFQWTHRGDRYSLPNPQAKKTRKTGGEVEDTVLLREDQKEYLKAVKNDVWRKRHNEKMLEEWIGGSGIDAMGSPFASGSYKRDNTKTGVKVGKGRYVNERRRRV
ncbi:Nin one binding Zn-ribbon like-domain-containing protein [Lipomyces arxii]|uniref:Nin one binding Zn-ribbon like-domain-containing protein n=1 Tax=Lipomyces arxii TaxID=56418 RepID=UPI0034CEB5C9